LRHFGDDEIIQQRSSRRRRKTSSTASLHQAKAEIEQMVERFASNPDADRALYHWQIAAPDRQTDALVYELYGLMEEKTAIVEGCLDRE